MNKKIVFFTLLFTLFLFLNNINAAAQDVSEFTVSGQVIDKEEIWDRRSNSLMGRPDILKEVILHIRVISLIKGSFPENSSRITVSIKKHEDLIKFRSVRKYQSGIFTISGSPPLYMLVSFIADSAPVPSKTVKYVPSPRATIKVTPVPFPDNISAAEIIKSVSLQEKAVKYIADKYAMRNASFVTVTSFQGPMPPEGGYKYWGVRGQIKGKWVIWQPGLNGVLRQGTEIYDPKMHQK